MQFLLLRFGPTLADITTKRFLLANGDRRQFPLFGFYIQSM